MLSVRLIIAEFLRKYLSLYPAAEGRNDLSIFSGLAFSLKRPLVTSEFRYVDFYGSSKQGPPAENGLNTTEK